MSFDLPSFFMPAAFAWPAGTQTVTVSFSTTNPLPPYVAGFSWAYGFTANQKAAVSSIFDNLNNLSGRKVTLLPDNAASAMVKIGWLTFDAAHSNLAGVCIWDDTPGAANIVGLNAATWSNLFLSPGGVGYARLLHELSHAVFDLADLPIIAGRNTMMDYATPHEQAATAWDQAVLVARYGAPEPVAFDAAYYLAQNPDVAAAGVGARWHYDHAGRWEGRDPNKYFDTSAYLEANPDVAAAGINPLDHYLTYGQYEGRLPYYSGSDDMWGW